jgi:hypothetical protein
MGWRRFEILGAHDFIIDLGIGSIILAAELFLRHQGGRICGLHAKARVAPIHFDDTPGTSNGFTTDTAHRIEDRLAMFLFSNNTFLPRCNEHILQAILFFHLRSGLANLYLN